MFYNRFWWQIRLQSWLALGFRNAEYILQPNQTIAAESILDLVGTTYVYILLDDFNNNKPNQDLVSFTNNVQSFNMPSYYVKTTMKPGENCVVQPDPPRNNCGKSMRIGIYLQT